MSESHDPTPDETAPTGAPPASEPGEAQEPATSVTPTDSPTDEAPSGAAPAATGTTGESAPAPATGPTEAVGLPETAGEAAGEAAAGSTATVADSRDAADAAVADARDAADAAVADAAEAAEAAADARDAAEAAAAAAAAVAGVEHEAVGTDASTSPDELAADAPHPADTDPIFDAAAEAADAAAAATAAAAAAEAAAERLTEVADRDPNEAAAIAAEALAAAAAAKEAAALAAAAAEAATRAASGQGAVPGGSVVIDPAVAALAPGSTQPGDAAAAAATVAILDGVAGAGATPRRANPLRRAAGAFVGTIAALIIGLATGILIVALAVAVLFNPIWVGIGQSHAESGLKTGYGPDDLKAATDSILADLVFGPPDFDVQVLGQPVLDDAERGHMRDVRTVFIGFAGLTLIALVLMIVARLASRGSVRFWKRVRRGAKVTAVITIALGLTGAVAFDSMFQLFHELLFPGGNFNFDPNTERLVQLFPEQFWLETTLVLGGVIVVLAYLVVRWAGRHIPARAKSAAVASGRTVAPGRPAG